MKPKKNPSKNLNQNSSLFFVIGLLCALMLSLVALEWKSFDSVYDPGISINHQENLIEEVVPENFKLEKPKLKQPIAQEIIIEDDDSEIDETDVLPTEADTNTEILAIEDISVVEAEEDVPVNWITIEEVPIFPGCEKAKDKRACFNAMIKKHISKYFKYPELAQEMGLQGRVSTQFTILKDGRIGAIKKRGPHPILEEEAMRILSKLPKMKPGMQGGKAVQVPFIIPITFKLQ